MDMDTATTTHIKLNTWELFTIIMIMWFIISLWGDVFKSLIKHFPLVMAAIMLVLTAALFAVTRIIGFNFITLIGKKPATEEDADE